MSGRRSSGDRAETEAERLQRKRKEADKKAAQTAEERAARSQSRTSAVPDDGMGDAAVSGRRTGTRGSPSPPESPDKTKRNSTAKRGSKRRSTDSLKSSSEEDEITTTGAAETETGKRKLAMVSGVQSFQVKSFKIIFLGNS